MERTIPSTASEEIELYQRTYYSLLRSSAEISIRSLEEAHGGMNSLLHSDAREPKPDMSAFIYALLRLPSVIPEVDLVIMGQSSKVFSSGGYLNVTNWEEVYAIARRRRTFYNGKGKLACFIASRSDIDDLIPLLTAYQLEWNKLHYRLQRISDTILLEEICESMSGYSRLASILEIPTDDLDRLYAIWDKDFGCNLQRIAKTPCDLRVHLLSGSMSEYRRARHYWWESIERAIPEIRERPIYFISSNVHSLVNVLSGYALKLENELDDFLRQSEHMGLLNEWEDIQTGKVPSSRENFLYYVLKKYQQFNDRDKLEIDQTSHEKSMGIHRISSRQSFDVAAQIIELSKINPRGLDPRLDSGIDLDPLSQSDALIINIDYPLGLAAYDTLSEISSHVGMVLGVYVMGKAATLNAVIGDVMICNVVHDEHSQNTYLFPNSFSAADIAPHLVYGTVLDNQKAVTVQGTFLQTRRYMDIFYREGYTDIEMEAGPYLSAVYEMSRPNRHPVNQIINLYGIPFDLGIIHYASDTPLDKGRNLGAGSLSYMGMDSTYAVTIAVLRRIFELELKRLSSN
jgi:hypothetical protein